MGSTVLGADCYIAGNWEKGQADSETLSVNPSTGQEIGRSPNASSEQVGRAVAAARGAFDAGPWPRFTAQQRGDLLHRLADLLTRDKEKLNAILTMEIGSPQSMSAVQLDMPIRHVRWAADAAVRGPQGGYEQQLPLNYEPFPSGSMLNRVPVGVVGAVTAYNFPLQIAIFKIAPALAAGCTVVLVPSPKAVLTTVALVRLIDEAGFPPGTVNLVFGPPEVTELVVGAPGMDLVSFTGSAAVGRKILALAAPNLTRAVLELGGKSPNIVLPGADIDATIEQSVLRFCRNAGQGCGALTRTLVPQGHLNDVISHMADFIRNSVTVGDPNDPKTIVGPLITDTHRTSVQGFVDRAQTDGAKIIIGGAAAHLDGDLERGFFYEPTLVTGVPSSSEIAQEELFAPVAVVLPYADVEDAVRIANDSRYGLNANVWGPTAKALEFARRVRSGTVTINGGGGMRADTPWGGFGDSGIGRECGEEGFREFFEVKHVQWPIG